MKSKVPSFGEGVCVIRYEPDRMHVARAEALTFAVSSSSGLLALCASEAVADAVAKALGGEPAEPPRQGMLPGLGG